jgi:hypothetical protein
MIQTDSNILAELRDAIDRRPGTRADFARAADIGQAYLSQILSGKRPLSRLPLETGRKISELSGISLDRLAGANDNRSRCATPPLAPSGDHR